MAKTIKGRTQNPAYTAAVLKAKNPVLLKGEVVYESDTTRHKIGDGSTVWNALPYAKGDFDGPLAADKGVAGCDAPLRQRYGENGHGTIRPRKTFRT